MNTSLTSDEVKLVVGIINDWINEGIVLPPYESNLQELLDKLGVTTDIDTDSEIYPKTQERLSRHGIKR